MLRRLGRQRVPMLAGWLFADLFLVLFVISLASVPPKAISKAVPKPVRHTAPPRELDRKPVTFTIQVAPVSVEDSVTRATAVSRLLRILRQDLVRRHMGRRRAGFVLVFASGPSTDTGEAITTANKVLRIVRSHDSVFTGASGIGYWQGSGASFEFKIFFFARSQ